MTHNFIVRQKKQFSLNLPQINKIRSTLNNDNNNNNDNKCIIVSMIGKTKVGKSSFINCFVSKILNENCCEANVASGFDRCTTGINQYVIELDNTNLIILDCEGCDSDNAKYLLPLIYCVSDIIVYNDITSLCSSICSTLNIISSIKRDVDKFSKPHLLFKVADYGVSAPPEDLLSSFLKSNHTKIPYTNLCEMFASVEIITTEQLGKKGKVLLQNNDYLAVAIDKDYGFDLACDKIISLVRLCQPTELAMIETNVEEVVEYINDKRLTEYTECFNKKLSTYQEQTCGGLADTIKPTILEKSYDECAIKLHIIDSITTNLNVSNPEFEEFEESDIIEACNQFRVNTEPRHLIVLNKCVELANKYIMDSIDSLLESHIFSFFKSLEIYGNTITCCGKKVIFSDGDFKYEDNQEWSKYSNYPSVDKICEYYRSVGVCENSIKSIELVLRTELQKLFEMLIEKICTETKLFESVSESITQEIGTEILDRYVNEKIYAVKNINRDFDYVFLNIVTDIENETTRKLEESIFKYCANLIAFNKEAKQFGLTFMQERGCKTLEDLAEVFKGLLALIRKQVDEVQFKSAHYKQVYTDHIVSTVKYQIDNRIIEANKNICFCTLSISGKSSNDSKTIAKILKANGFNYPFVINKGTFTLTHFSKNIEDMLQWLCAYVNVKYTFVIDEIFVNNEYVAINHCHCNVHFDNSMVAQFIDRIMQKYFDETYAIAITHLPTEITEMAEITENAYLTNQPTEYVIKINENYKNPMSLSWEKHIPQYH